MRPSRAKLAHNRIRIERLRAARALGNHTDKEWVALRKKAQVCPKCLQPSRHGFLERDHIVPIHKGGSNALSNIQPLCRGCNRNKGHDTTDWMSLRGWR